MHEMAIAASLVEHVLEVAQQNGAARVSAIELEIGALQLVVPEALELAFQAVTQGTLAEGATLKVTEIKAVAECRLCSTRFEAKIDDYLCPQCRQADVRLVAGNDILLKSITCEVQQSGHEKD
ncbi:MAG: hydrogenase maturation nickel metallochaperone HypA [Phycisphaerae bacterium]|jgi:hydrogenase nickel incorporation protein HypA/HybF|nr:hydrogenase maturation nickel metallochaperone HypA [Phycisphaerae bacterium]NLG44352.1 hydrogenase maturation nickel metallochaperone HypA [Phycisphaerae bacterium]HOO16161.1 hydrogenase maturation nickel metallochaperone HypA [Phycisphaerae bacterium]HPC22009.1 hydrogenase maturation nickel metallochaperone HypA [Phycisphaerae bacterium]HRS27551.1 hydrogenase maturation nickel metallochaperone HypA [Phycisphaerae bacterium]